ncbi:hypothetical protein Slip_1518 [Syntrophothermus lipocalidus DSM 12680]|uniref:Uncharacterized protein n=1 Tax=Syntrophothermus lipocalidus (strain DSM 12680 / TGB-C1) TaxID=643648 RepID=D7CNJ6_SYNLT|nr:hypothetical protein Slip_1518 [Syntrophothermus lipocalidus DSM 12680]
MKSRKELFFFVLTTIVLVAGMIGFLVVLAR